MMAPLDPVTKPAMSALERAGDQASFYGSAFASTGRALRHRSELLRLIAEASMGAAALALLLGTVGGAFAVALISGTEIALQGYSALNTLGLPSFLALLSSFFATRELAPLVPAFSVLAIYGTGITAQLGAMRVNEEVDALESMGIRPLPFLVSTRLIAGFVMAIPIFLLGLLGEFFAIRLTTVYVYGIPAGNYDALFFQYLSPIDILLALIKAFIMITLTVLICAYYGYSTRGGPAEVGVSVARATRASIIAIVISNFFLSLAIWGPLTTVRISG